MAGLQPRRLSASNIDTFNQCKYKFYLHYFEKPIKVQDTLALRFGSAVHQLLEALMHEAKTAEWSKELCEHYAVQFPKVAATFDISDQTLIQDGINFVRNRYYRHNPDYDILHTEINLEDYELRTAAGTPFTGVIDLILKLGRPTAGMVLDYKTSRVFKTQDEVNSDVQLSMYDLAVRVIFPELKELWLCLDFLRGDPVMTSRTHEERMAFIDFLDTTWGLMGQLTPETAEPQINKFCGWCAYQHACPKYKELASGRLELAPVSMLNTTEDFVQAYKEAKAMEKVIDKRIEELRGWIDHKINTEDTTYFEGRDVALVWNQTTTKSYDAKTLLEKLPPEDLSRLVKFNNRTIEAYINQERPYMVDVLKQAVRIRQGSSRLDMKTKK